MNTYIYIYVYLHFYIHDTELFDSEYLQSRVKVYLFLPHIFYESVPHLWVENIYPVIGYSSSAGVHFLYSTTF